jgi:hypothetical protein
MNNDYLWDRTGQPDPEIQRLEEILGALRYEPRQLAIPAQLRPRRRRMFFPPLAIAAAIAMMVVAAGLWLTLGRQMATQPHEALAFPVALKSNDGLTLAAKPSPQAPRKALHLRLQSNLAARNVPARRNITAASAEMTSGELAEAEEAKERLMLALRVASTKLSLAQRKAQGAPAANTIRNQHRIG